MKKPSRKEAFQFVETFLKGLHSSSQWKNRSRFKKLAVFLGIPEVNWREAACGLLRMHSETGRRTLRRFESVIKETDSDTIRSGLVGFIRLANKHGLINWKSPHTHGDKWLARRAGTSPEFLCHMDAWSRDLESRNYSRKTIRGYQRHLLELGAYLKRTRLQTRDLDDVRLTRWLKSRIARQHAPYVVGKCASVVRLFYTWLSHHGHVRIVPKGLIPLPRTHRRTPRLLSENDVLKLIKAAIRERDRAYIEVLYASGCRIGELISIDLKNVDFNERVARCTGKVGERTLLLNQHAIQAIHQYLPIRARELAKHGRPREPALFLGRKGARLSLIRAQGLLYELSDRARFTKRVGPHLIRHAFATHMLNRGAGLVVLQKLLGHAHVKETDRYAQVAPKNLFHSYHAAAIDL